MVYKPKYDKDDNPIGQEYALFGKKGRLKTYPDTIFTDQQHMKAVAYFEQQVRAWRVYGMSEFRLMHRYTNKSTNQYQLLQEM